MIYFASFLSAFVLTLLLLFFLIRVLTRFKIAEQPRADRWHRFPRPKFGGIGIFAGSMIVFLTAYSLPSAKAEPFPLTLFVGSVLIFLFGLLDDIKPLTPTGKLITQIIAASLAVFFGYTTNFFSPRLGDTFLAKVLNSGVSLLWLIAVTNAMNLIDNMDGLAAGISLIVCLILGYFFWDSGDYWLLLFCSALGGAILGFLFLNFPPAKIFMGDSGSQFLGYTLALLAIARQPQASNVFAIVGVPALLFTLPLVDTFFVTVTRWLRGESPFKGGRDHTSHRLIAFGLSERQALGVLYSIALVAGITAILVEALNYTLSLILLPMIVIFLLISTAYLAGVRLAEVNYTRPEKKVQKILIKVFLGRSLLEVLIDGFLIAFSFYLAVSFGVSLPQAEQIEFFIQTLPLALISGYLAFFFMQIYRDLWRHLRVENTYRYAQAALWAGFLLWVVKFILATNIDLTATAILIFGATLFFGLMVTRFSFQAFDTFSAHSRMEKAERILLYTSEESIEFIVPYLTHNQNNKFHLLGLVTDQEVQIGKRVFDLQVLGTIDRLKDLVRKYAIQGIILEESKARNPAVRELLLSLIEEEQCWVKVLALDLIDYNPYLSSAKTMERV